MRPCLGLKSRSAMSTGYPYQPIHRHIALPFPLRGAGPVRASIATVDVEVKPSSALSRGHGVAAILSA